MVDILSPTFVSMLIILAVVIYFITEEEEYRRRIEEEEFNKRTKEAYDRCEKKDEEYSIDEFLEEMEKW